MIKNIKFLRMHEFQHSFVFYSSYYHKPSFDLSKCLSDGLEFKNFLPLNANTLANKQITSIKATNFSRISYKKIWIMSNVSQIKDDLQTIANMIKGSVIIK